MLLLDGLVSTLTSASAFQFTTTAPRHKIKAAEIPFKLKHASSQQFPVNLMLVALPFLHEGNNKKQMKFCSHKQTVKEKGSIEVSPLTNPLDCLTRANASSSIN